MVMSTNTAVLFAIFTAAVIAFAWMPRADAALGIDFDQRISEEQMECVKSAGYDFGSVLGWHSYGSFENECPRNLRYMHRAGLSPADVYLLPCATMDASDQIETLISTLRQDNASYNTLWIGVQTGAANNCAWPPEHMRNCKYVGAMIAAGQNAFKTVGVVTSEFQWGSLMGESCTVGSNLDAPLWYSHYDRHPNFDDFRPFGGWETPYAKQYAATTLCEISCNLSYSNNQSLALPAAGGTAAAPTAPAAVSPDGLIAEPLTSEIANGD